MKLSLLYEYISKLKKPARPATINIRRILRKGNRNFQSDRAPVTRTY